MSEYRGKELIIKGSNGYEWYKDYVGKKFVIQSENRNKKSFVVRTTWEQAGWPYGWVDKKHCALVS